LATRAVYTFTDFPETPVRHLYLHRDGSSHRRRLAL
jgi:hypothetical protein